MFFLSFKLKPAQGRPEVKIDLVGVVLAAVSIILISFGFNNLNRWGLGVARPGAPFDIFGFSPAPIMIVLGIVLLQTFIVWTRRQQEAGKTPLLDLRVITSNQERAAVICMFSVVLLEAMLNFSVPLYIQIIQGRTPIETAIAMLPFNLTVFFTAMLVVRLYTTLTPRRIGQLGFVLCTVALLWLAFVVRNDWSAVPRHVRAHRLRHRPGRPGDARLQRAGHGGAQGTGRRRGIAARHDAEPRGRRRDRGRGRAFSSACSAA